MGMATLVWLASVKTNSAAIHSLIYGLLAVVSNPFKLQLHIIIATVKGCFFFQSFPLWDS